MEKCKPGPVFKRVLACFDSEAEFARQVGLKDRRNVREWKVQFGYIPLRWAVTAAMATGGKVTAVEIVNETAKIMERRRIQRETIAKMTQEGPVA